MAEFPCEYEQDAREFYILVPIYEIDLPSEFK